MGGYIQINVFSNILALFAFSGTMHWTIYIGAEARKNTANSVHSQHASYH